MKRVGTTTDGILIEVTPAEVDALELLHNSIRDVEPLMARARDLLGWLVSDEEQTGGASADTQRLVKSDDSGAGGTPSDASGVHMSRKCTNCHVLMPDTAFYRGSARCKSCVLEKQKLYKARKKADPTAPRPHPAARKDGAPGMKVCKACNVEKPTEAFYPRQGKCKWCYNAACRERQNAKKTALQGKSQQSTGGRPPHPPDAAAKPSAPAAGTSTHHNGGSSGAFRAKQPVLRTRTPLTDEQKRQLREVHRNLIDRDPMLDRPTEHGRVMPVGSTDG